MTKSSKDFVDVPKDDEDFFEDIDRILMHEELEELDKIEDQLHSSGSSTRSGMNEKATLTRSVLGEEQVAALKKKLFGI